MTMTCEIIQDQLADYAAGRVDDEARAVIESHLVHCGACQEELDTLALLVQATPAAPRGFEARVQAAVQGVLADADAGTEATEATASENGSAVVPISRRRAWFGPTWGLAAAAVMALLIGRSLVDTGEEPGLGEVALGYEDVPVLIDEGMIAGAPALDGLSDEDLALLLEEWDG